LWWQAPARRADPHWRVGALTRSAFEFACFEERPTGNPASIQRSPGGVRPLHIDQIALPSQFGHWALRSEGAWGNPRSPFPVTQPRLAQDWRGFFVTPAASFLRMPSWRPRGSRHSRGSDCDLRGAKRLSPISRRHPMGAALTLKMRPTISPSASTSKSSSFQSRERRLVDARWRMRESFSIGQSVRVHH
jgi:hypothetical protein